MATRCVTARGVPPATAPVARAARAPLSTRTVRASASDKAEDTPLSEKIINAVTVALTNSPVNEGKKLLAKAQAGDYDAAAWKAKIEAEIAATPVIVYSWLNCPFCKKGKAILEANMAGMDTPPGFYKVLEIDQMGQDGKIYRAALSEKTGRTSMPQIFINKEFCGGCNDGPGVATLEREGKLKGMLAAAAKA